MIFHKEKNWKQFLSSADEEELNRIINRARNHRAAYLNAKEIKIAQLWCALLELKKEKNDIENRLKRLEFLLGGIEERAVRLDKQGKTYESLENF